jgi:murein DD-endopeptidase MepM/ murein hydrolase activator NlpD
MKKIKYYFNTHTLKYEKYKTPLRVKLLRFFGLISMLIVSSAIVIYLYNRFFPKPGELEARKKYNLLKENFDQVNSRVKEIEEQMAALEQRDNEVYRSIFEANPVPDSVRAKIIEQRKGAEQFKQMSDQEISKDIHNQLNNIQARIKYQFESYENIAVLIKNQDQKLSCIPAIQPVSNKQLNRIASGFGMRVDPVYGTPKMHKGLDFAAPQGTPIYATGDGIVSLSTFSENGYGHHVIINHGYGYETLYGHMVKTNVQNGQQVKRGQIIGWVGSTGKSTGPHCHYEVHVNNQHVDPVYFFYNDLNPDEYDRILKIAATGSAKSFD